MFIMPHLPSFFIITFSPFIANTSSNLFSNFVLSSLSITFKVPFSFTTYKLFPETCFISSYLKSNNCFLVPSIIPYLLSEFFTIYPAEELLLFKLFI